MNIDAERPVDELSGAAAIDALHDALLDITAQPRVRFANVRDIEVRKAGRWVIVKVKSKGGGDVNELTFRISKAWGKVLLGRLRRVID